MKLFATFATALVLLCAPLFGQNSFTWTPTVTLIDNTSYCGTHNCLTPIGGTLALSEIEAGPDRTVYGLTSAGALYTYTQPAGWVLAPTALQSPGGGSITHISVGMASQVLALNNAAAPTANVYVLDSTGTAWVALAGSPHLVVAEIGSDGSIWGLTSTHAIYSWNGSVWTPVSGTLSNLANAGAGNVWGVNSSGLIQDWNGTAFAALSPTPSFTPSQATDAIATAGGGGLAILDTSGGIHVSSDAGSTWKTVQGTATAIAGAGSASMFALNGSASYHLNLLVQQLGVKATGNWACPFTWVAGGPQIPCSSSLTNTMTAIAKFGGAGGAHGTAGFTGTNVISMTGPTNPQTVSAWEQARLCDLFDAPGAPECTPLLDGAVTNSLLGLLQSATAPGFLPDWIVPPVAPAPGESLYWWPLTGDPVLYSGSDPDYSASGRGTAITLTKNINYNPAFMQSPSASWTPVSAPPVPAADITRIYGVTRGSFNGIGGASYLGNGPWTGSGIGFVGNFSAWSGVVYSLLSPSGYYDPHNFPWSTYNPVMQIPDSVYWSGTSTFTTTDIGFLLYVAMPCPTSASAAWTDKLDLSLLFPTLLTGIGNVSRVTVAPGSTNWDGQKMRETVSQTSNSCPKGFPNACVGSSTFTIGVGGQPSVCTAWNDANNCTAYTNVGPLLVATHNQFFDQHTGVDNVSLLSSSSCAQTCSQQYYCGSQQILNHTFTYKFQKSTMSGTTVTLVTLE